MESTSSTSGNHYSEELHKLDAQFDAQLKSIYAVNSKRKGPVHGEITGWLVRIVGKLLIGTLLLVGPFILLVKVSVYTYEEYQLGGWAALFLGASTTFVLLLLYGIIISFKVGSRTPVFHHVSWVSALLVLAYSCYGLIYLSGVNVKNEKVGMGYRQLHPILRVTMATATLADPNLMITDTDRIPIEYSKMGLPLNEQSLHYRQSTGYVHAVDLRTSNRAEWKNWLTEKMLGMLGYYTLRHVGTADHLHVSLPLND